MAGKEWLAAAGLFALLLLLLSGVMVGPGEDSIPLPPVPQEVFLCSMEALYPEDVEAPGMKPSVCLRVSSLLPPTAAGLNIPAPARDSNGRVLPGAGYIRWVYTLFRQSAAAG